MENALSTITAMPATKEQIHTFVQKAKGEILSGTYDPLEIEIYLKAMEETIKAIRSDREVRDYVLSEAEKYGKSFEYKGAKVNIREAGVRYDFSACGDPVHDKLTSEVKDLTEQKKAREKLLKALTGEMADPESGAVINPPVKTSSTTIAITL